MSVTSGSLCWHGLVIEWSIDTDRSPEGHGTHTTIDRVEVEDSLEFLEAIDTNRHPALWRAIQDAAWSEAQRAWEKGELEIGG